ncbi:hypothetical protein LTR09_006190 [Extremus antarcticus]|uniref:CoA carboxyltransferase C-terminal domain-containing protein n=1 Tax=Extremus antarcticus TaxID=702011 RepID=A0AAJ0GBT7_9PEZI|nr:hypothetical protein LTR09_006190 [Extremus antarcticus]
MKDDESKPAQPAGGADTPSQTDKATSRAVQVSEHISPSHDGKANTGRRRRKAKDDELPADYSDLLGQMRTMRKMANNPDTSKTGYIRQKEAGKLWVRERIALLLDKGSFKEVGSVAGHVKWKFLGGIREEPEEFTAYNNLQGAGHQDGNLMAKTLYMEKMAIALKLPMIKLVDGSSGGGSVSSIAAQQFSYVPPMQGFDTVIAQLNMGIPNLGAVLGPAIGLGAARVVCCHFSVMAADVGSLFNAGPKVVAGATFEEGLSFTELGGPGMHCTNGTIDNYAATEIEAFEQIRTVLGYLPNCGTQVPPVVASDDPFDRVSTELRSIVPRRRERMYDIRKIISTVADAGSWFEIGALWGRTAIIGLARLAGRPIGIVANNAEVATGALDASGSQKITRHLKFCDIFNLPVLQFVDVPGYAIGTVAERTATMRWGVELAKAYYSTTMPMFHVIVRKAYGVAGGIMVDCREPRMRVGWPSGEWGSLPLEGGVEVGHSGELRQIEKESGLEARQARLAELDTMYKRLMNPVRTANHFSIEELIDPARTREVVAEWCRIVYEAELPERVIKRVHGQIQPSYA